MQQPSVLVGLIGAGIQASRTPAMHEREGGEHGLRYLYKLIDLDLLQLDAAALPELVTAAERMGFAGLNITYPCKQAVIPLLTGLSQAASAIGAVNTVVLSGGKRIGHNTDSSGFAEAFRRDMADAPRERVLQLGAGGAGAAVAHAVLECGARHLAIVDVDRQKAAALVDGLRARFGADCAEAVTDVVGAVAKADGLINTTPVGMAKLPGAPIDLALLRRELWVADVIYFPMETELLARARALGCRTMSGAGMAVFQAVGAFRLFSGREPDPERMYRHFLSM
jgi:shikimate dehydrogenase